MGTHQSQVQLFFDGGRTVVEVASQKIQDTCSFTSGMVNLTIPAQVFLDIDTKIPGLISLFQCDAKDVIRCSAWRSFPGYTHGFAFGWIELHTPSLGPLDHGVKVLLESFYIFR